MFHTALCATLHRTVRNLTAFVGRTVIRFPVTEYISSLESASAILRSCGFIGGRRAAHGRVAVCTVARRQL